MRMPPTCAALIRVLIMGAEWPCFGQVGPPSTPLEGAVVMWRTFKRLKNHGMHGLDLPDQQRT